MEPYCDSDEEVFFGPVTLKEVKKALSLPGRMHVRNSNTTEAEATKSRAAGRKEQLALNLTFTPQMNCSKEKDVWDRRSSLDENAVKLFAEEAPAPPPSPEKMEYNGSPFPTPCSHPKVRHSRLNHIAEEDETDKQLDTRKRGSMHPKLSILTTMDDSLTEGAHKPLPMEPKGFDNTNIDDAQEASVKPTEEGINGRAILLEKMKDYEAQEQHIKSMKRGPLKVALEDSLIELSTDDLLILDDVENDDYFSEESTDSPVVHCENAEVNEDDSAGIVPRCKELLGGRISDLRFSRLVSERIKDSCENQHLEALGSNFLGDFERRYGKHKLNEVLASLNSKEENPERMRPVSPEYDLVGVNADKTCESRCSSSLNSSKTSHSDSVVEISILEDNLSSEVDDISYGFGNISVVEHETEVLSDQISLPVQKNNTEVDNSVTCLSDADLSESRKIIANESRLCNNQSSRESSPEYGEDSKMTNVTKDSLQLESSTCQSHKDLEIESMSCSRRTALQDSTINSHTSFSDRACKIPCNSQEYAKTKCAETVCNDLQNSASNMGVKSYIMSDQYSLISEAESEPYTPSKKDAAYSTKPIVSLASFDEKVLSVADEDGGFLSVLSEAALLHASLTHHNASVNGRQMDIDLTDLDTIPTRDQGGKNGTEINSVHSQNYANVTTKCENSNELMLNSSGTNKECDATAIHPSVCVDKELKDSFVERVNISRHDYDSMQLSNEDLEADNYAGETNALDDLSETDKEHLEKHTSFSSPAEKFNDTLEEMEMLLKYGYSYSLSNNDEDLRDNTHKSSGVEGAVEHLTPNRYVERSQNLAVMKSDGPNATESKAQKSPRLPSTFDAAYGLPDCSISPIQHPRAWEKSHLPVFKKSTNCPNPDKVQSSVNKAKVGTKELESPFKVPTKPISQTAIRPGTPRVVKQKPMPTTPVASSPFKKTGYKKIVSPVGMYIHNVPSPSLVTNVKSKGPSPSCRTPKGGPVASSPLSGCMLNTPEKPKACVVSKNNAENIDINNLHPILPMVSYKSAPALKLDEKQMEKLPKMNDRMKKLIDTPRPQVIRHEGRVKVEPSPQMKKFVSPKRSKCTDNSFNASDPEISVVVEKKATRTNTVGI